jgi:hypothetical protein
MKGKRLFVFVAGTILLVTIPKSDSIGISTLENEYENANYIKKQKKSLLVGFYYIRNCRFSLIILLNTNDP